LITDLYYIFSGKKSYDGHLFMYESMYDLLFQISLFSWKENQAMAVLGTMLNISVAELHS
jgi:hypothetical protein